MKNISSILFILCFLIALPSCIRDPKTPQTPKGGRTKYAEISQKLQGLNRNRTTAELALKICTDYAKIESEADLGTTAAKNLLQAKVAYTKASNTANAVLELLIQVNNGSNRSDPELKSQIETYDRELKNSLTKLTAIANREPFNLSGTMGDSRTNGAILKDIAKLASAPGWVSIAIDVFELAVELKRKHRDAVNLTINSAKWKNVSEF